MPHAITLSHGSSTPEGEGKSAAIRRGSPRLPSLRTVAYGVLLLWGGFWIWFCGVSWANEGAPAAPYAGGVIACMLGLLTASWFWPRAGGVLLIVAAAFSVWFFPSQAALLLMSLPAAVAGVLLLIGRRR